MEQAGNKTRRMILLQILIFSSNNIIKVLGIIIEL